MHIDFLDWCTQVNELSNSGDLYTGRKFIPNILRNVSMNGSGTLDEKEENKECFLMIDNR